MKKCEVCDKEVPQGEKCRCWEHYGDTQKINKMKNWAQAERVAEKVRQRRVYEAYHTFNTEGGAAFDPGE